jgi:hypothetical protein
LRSSRETKLLAQSKDSRIMSGQHQFGRESWELVGKRSFGIEDTNMERSLAGYTLVSIISTIKGDQAVSE